MHGASIVHLDPDYAETVNTSLEYQVFLTPYGDCKGLYVTNRTPNSFEVRELGGGISDLSFGYRIMAVRRNYENVRLADQTAEMERLRRSHERIAAEMAHPRIPNSAKDMRALSARVKPQHK
jgi:hypothetical protein